MALGFTREAGGQAFPGSPWAHALVGTCDAAVAEGAGQEHGQVPCNDDGLLDNGDCCNVAQCVTMHGGLPAVSFPDGYKQTLRVPTISNHAVVP